MYYSSVAIFHSTGRCLQFFYFGLGLGRVRERALSNGVVILRGCCQLLEEWEYHFASQAVQSVVRHVMNCKLFIALLMNA